MAAAVVCRACGAKIKEGRTQCLRCGEPLVAANSDAQAPPRPPFVSQHRGPLLIAGTISSLIVLLLFVTMQQPPVPAVSDAPQSIAGTAAAAQLSRASSARRAQPPFLEPKTAFDSARAGAAAYSKANFAGALEHYQLAVEKNPKDPGALNDLGQVLVRLGRAKEALTYFKRAIELSPSAWAPQFNLAHAYGALGDWEHAIPEYQKAAELFPDDYVTHYNLAMAFHKAGKEEPAVGEFQKAIALAPGEASFRLSLGISYELLNRPAEAAKAYEEYLELEPAASEAAKIRTHIETLRKPA